MFTLAFIMNLNVSAFAEVRVPAEWEPHDSTWMQWPFGYETSYRETFSNIIDVLQAYEPVHIIVRNWRIGRSAIHYLFTRGVPLHNITFHVVPHNSAWLRDNGPIWVERDGQPACQDWGFDGWGGWTPAYRLDDRVPRYIAYLTDTPYEDYNHIILEKGTMEFNGTDTLITSWNVLSDRNPGMSKQDLEEVFFESYGVSRVVWLERAPGGDGTGGHVDGIARFIDEDTVAVAEYADQSDPDAEVFEDAARIISEAGLEVVRVNAPGTVTYKWVEMTANYMNWLVANDVVLVCGFGHEAWDNAARQQIAGFFPGRDVVVVNALELWYNGGGIHCVTNDMPDLTVIP